MGGWTHLPLTPYLHTYTSECLIKVIELGILLFNQVDLPLPLPILELFLASNGFLRTRKRLSMHKLREIIPARKAIDLTTTVLTDSSAQIVRHADVEHGIPTICQDVYPVLI